MTYCPDIEMTIEDPMLVVLYDKFASHFRPKDNHLLRESNYWRLALKCHDDNLSLVEYHKQQIANDPSYCNTDRYKVLEACIKRYFFSDREWLVTVMKKEENLIDEQQEDADIASLLDPHTSALYEEIRDLKDKYKQLTEEYQELQQHSDWMTSECNRPSNQSGGGILGNLGSSLSPMSKWLAEFQLDSALQEWSIKRMNGKK